jgi:hypothetical protein
LCLTPVRPMMLLVFLLPMASATAGHMQRLMGMAL